MKLGPEGTAFLPGGCSLPAGSYPVYAEIDLDDDGSATGEAHFSCEPKHPRPIPIGKEFDLHLPHPDSILGDNVILNVSFVDDSGAVVGYAHGSRAQFRSKSGPNLKRLEDSPVGSRDVFVIHGRDEHLRSGMFDFLRSLGLNPMEWSHAVELTGKGAPYVGEVLDAAFSHAQAVVVLFTPDDLAMLRADLRGANEPGYESSLKPQARPNVLFESGMAMARSADRTILVEIGDLRPFSDVGGRHMLRMDNSVKKRNELAARLKTAGCPVNMTGTDWQTAGDMAGPPAHQEQAVPSPTARDQEAGDVRGAHGGNPAPTPPRGAIHPLADLISELEDNLDAARAPRAGDVYVRPSNSVWKRDRNRLSIPTELRNRLTNAYRQINSWLDIVLSGLSPNLGSPALHSMVAALRSELPELISELKKLEH
jgi:predicted nucleotide-binding protein